MGFNSGLKGLNTSRNVTFTLGKLGEMQVLVATTRFTINIYRSVY